MSKTIINFVLDSVMAVSFLATLWISTVLHFIFPAPLQTVGWSLWGMDYGHWLWIHFASQWIFAVMVLIHVMLHWSWVCGVVAHRLSQRSSKRIAVNESQQTIAGVAVLVLLLHVLGALFLCAMLTVRQSGSTARLPDASFPRRQLQLVCRSPADAPIAPC